MLPRISFSDAAANLAMLVASLEDDDEIDGLIEQQFQDALTDISASIDRRKAFYRELDSKIELAKRYRDEVTKHIKKYELIQDRLVNMTKRVILQHPDITFKDSFGASLKVLPNPVPKVVIDGPNSHEDHLHMSSYYEVVPKMELNMKKVKADLEAGIELPWAHLEHGTQLRGIK